MATHWLWADAGRVDGNADKTWLFATSSPGLFPLASQCNHEFQWGDTRHPRRSDPHTRFPPALCTKFAKLCEARFSGTFHALTDAVTLGAATVAMPSRLPTDEINTWTPAMVYVGRGGTIALKTFPGFPFEQQFQSVVLGRTETISFTGMFSLKTRSSEPSCRRQQARR